MKQLDHLIDASQLKKGKYYKLITPTNEYVYFKFKEYEYFCGEFENMCYEKIYTILKNGCREFYDQRKNQCIFPAINDIIIPITKRLYYNIIRLCNERIKKGKML